MKSWNNLFLVLTLFVSQAFFSQATFTSRVNGNWNSTSTWELTSGTDADADGIPDADDAVIIKAHTVNVTANAACASLTTDPDADNTSGLSTTISTTDASNITISSNMLLTIVGDFFIKANNSFNRVTVLTGPGSVTAGSLTIGNNIAVSSSERNTTLAVRTTTNFEILGNVNLYTNVDGNYYNSATFRHDSGTITINGQMNMTQEAPGTATQYTSNLGTEKQGILILKNITPILFTPLNKTSTSQLRPVFTGCTVQYSPMGQGLTLFNTNYRDLKIDSNYSVNANNLTINENGNLYLIKGLVNGKYNLNNNVTIIRSNGEVLNAPTLGIGKIYNLTYAQRVDRTIPGPEFIANSTQLETLTISNTNGVQINQVCLPNQLIVTVSGDLTGAGDIRVRTLFDVPAAVTFNTGGLITLVSTFSNTARVAPLTNNPTINGNVTVERYLNNQERKWRLITAPLKGNTNNSVFYNWQNNGTVIEGYGTDIWGPNGNPTSNGLQQIFNSSHNLRRFNNSSNNWTNITNSFTETLFTENINKGFLIFATHPYGQATDGLGNVNQDSPSLTTTLKATGNLITGDVNYTDVPASGFYIVGNPYASPIDFKTMLNDASNTGIGKKLWFIDPALGSYGAYVTWDNVNGYSDYTTTRNPGASSSPSNQTTFIQSGEAFFIKSTGTATSFTIKETHKASTNSNAVFNRKAADITSERIRVLLDKQENDVWNKKDAIVVGFYDGGNSAYDSNDVGKLTNPKETISFVTDNFSLSSEHRAPIQDKEFLNVKIAQLSTNTNYKLRIFTEDFTYTGQAFLEDLFLNTSTPIALDGSTFEYAFQVTTDPLSTGSRFKINFVASTLGATTPTASQFVIYPNPTTVEKGLTISFNTAVSAGYSYKIFNPAGQLIESNSITVNNKLGNIAFHQKLKSGVYYLNIYDENNELKNSKTIIIQ